MRILFLDQFNELGGAQRCLIDLVDGISEGELYAAIPGNGALSDALRRRGVCVYELPRVEYSNGRKAVADVMRFAMGMPRLARRIGAIVQMHGIEMVYVNGPRMLPAAAIASRDLLFHAHSYLEKRYASGLVGWCLRWRQAHVIASSQFVAGPLPPDRLRVIYNGVPELPFRPPNPPDGRPWRIGIVGRIAPEKGHLDFVRAARVLTERGMRGEYFIHGAPLFSDSSYLARVREESSGLPIVFPGWSDDVSVVFAGLDLLAVPSSHIDATPRVIMEAFSAGVPVVAYPSGGIPELIEDGVTGVLTKSLSEGIEALLTHPERMSSIARAARRKWEEDFTVQRYVRQVQEFLATAQAGNTNPRLSRAVPPSSEPRHNRSV
jgi:glycosyltransferase involved in cell wall biosynthesis